MLASRRDFHEIRKTSKPGKNIMRATTLSRIFKHLWIATGILLVTIHGPWFQRAHAAATMTLNDGAGHTMTVTDGGVGDQSPDAGAITFNNSLGVWSVIVATGLTKPVIGCPWQPKLELMGPIQSTGAGTLTITFTDGGFIPPGMGGAVAVGSFYGAHNSGTGSFNYSILQGTNIIATTGTVTSNSFIWSSTNSVSTVSNYSLTQKIVIVHTGAGFSSISQCDADVTNLLYYLNNCPPTLAPISNRVVSAGQTLMITNVAYEDIDRQQTLTFNMLTGVSNASFTPISGPANYGVVTSIFSWRAPVSLANTTNPVTFQVTDNGINPSNDIKSFNIIVKPLTGPSVSQITATNDAAKLLVNGDIGPDYTVQTSTNLTNWATLLTSNSPVTPFSWSDTNASNFLQRFYRVLLGP